MFSWFRRTTEPPPTAPSNPGSGHTLVAAFANGERTWDDSADVLASLAEVLRRGRYRFSVKERWITLTNGLVLLPQVASFEPRDDGGVSTTSTIQVSHPDLVPDGVFEYQHSQGSDLGSSFAKGFRGFADCDLPVFLDALKEKPETTTVLAKSVPSPNAPGALLHRRMVLGPVVYSAQIAAPDGFDEEHPFCPCCLLTNTFSAFNEQLASPAFHAIRLFAMRDATGEALADCRIDGDDWAPGKEALLRYVATWPHRGIEYRKQYVSFQTLTSAPAVA